MRIAAARPDLFELCAIQTRDIARARQWMQPYNVPLVTSLDDLLAHKPLFVITSVPWDVNPGMLHQLAARGIPALSETPPATSIDEMHALHALVRAGARIAVAEQYHLQPDHAARIAFAHSGRLGAVTQAQVSVAHGYHGISLMRRLLGISFENARIHATRFHSPIIKSPDRSGPPAQQEIVPSQQVIATFEFPGKLGVFDFSDDQYFSYIRGKRVLVRGERGEIIDDRAVYLQDQRTPLQVDFKRHTAGAHGNLEGWFLKGIQVGTEWIYHNPLAPAAFADDEIAVGHCLLKMADYADGGEAFYSLAEACQDRYLDILIWQSVESGQPVHSQTQPWSD
jgi:predicted dehydrogenase